jgi:hypothetical protein
MGVIEGVEVGVNAGKEPDMAVTVRIADVSIAKIGDKVESGLGTPRLHALSRKITATININKYFFIHMAASKRTQDNLLRGKNYSIKNKSSHKPLIPRSFRKLPIIG